MKLPRAERASANPLVSFIALLDVTPARGNVCLPTGPPRVPTPFHSGRTPWPTGLDPSTRRRLDRSPHPETPARRPAPLLLKRQRAALEDREQPLEDDFGRPGPLV